MFEWLYIEWRRFCVWLDWRKEHPGAKIKVFHEGQGNFRVMVFKSMSRQEVEKAKRDADEQRERMKAFLGTEEFERRERIERERLARKFAKGEKEGDSS